MYRVKIMIYVLLEQPGMKTDINLYLEFYNKKQIIIKIDEHFIKVNSCKQLSNVPGKT